jgi:hypothetical protein
VDRGSDTITLSCDDRDWDGKESKGGGRARFC